MPWLLDFLSCPSPLRDSAVSLDKPPGLPRLAAISFTNVGCQDVVCTAHLGTFALLL